MTISDRKLRSIHRRKVVPVLDTIDGWDDVDPGTPESSWVSTRGDARSLVERDRDALGSDLSRQWSGTSRASLAPLAGVIGDLVHKVGRRERRGGRQLSATVYEMH
jgi:hypothetical protein